MKTLPVKTKINGLKLIEMLVVLAVLAVAQQVAAQSSQFFRILGPAATTITAFNPDGTLVWSNAQSGTNYTVQTVSSLPGGTNWVDYVQIPVTNSINTNLLISFNPPAGMKLIPAGVFTMGDILDGETNAVPVSVTVSAFYMDTNLVSYSQWQSVYNWATNNGYGFVNAGAGKATNHPVQTVDWYDCVKWCNARSQQAGLTPVYYTDTNFTQVYTNGEESIGNTNVNWSANGYRLPTEAEWEKAARGGLSGERFPWGNTISESRANYFANTATNYDLGPNGFNTIGNFPTTSPGTSPVGSFAPNGYGLYDTAGNTLEWCWDWYFPAYAGGSDPRGPDSSPYHIRILRGGSWGNNADQARCAYRYWVSIGPTDNSIVFGFRCARGF